MKGWRYCSVYCVAVLIWSFFYGLAFAQGEYQESYEALMKQGLAVQQTEYYPGALSYRLEDGYAVFSHFNATKKQASFALVSFDVNDKRKGELELFCREHAKEILLRKWLREFLRTHLEEAINERLDGFEEDSDSFLSKSGAIEDARGASQELLFNAFVQFDLESICRGVLGGCRERTEVVLNTAERGRSGCFFFAQYSVDEKAAEKNVASDVRGIMVALRRTLCGELAKLARQNGQASAHDWSETECKLMRAYVVLIYVLGDDSVSWTSFCTEDTPPVQLLDGLRWQEFINLIFKNQH